MGKYLVIAGNGETTRVNVEALLEDHFRGNGKEDLILLLPFFDRPSQGQVWAHQVSVELGVPTVAVAPENGIIMSLGGASIHNSPDPISEIVSMVRGEHVNAFLLWAEPDEATVAIQQALQGASVPCYDLCRGLVGISAGTLPEIPSEGVVEDLKEVVKALKVSTQDAPFVEVESLIDQIAVRTSKLILTALREEGLLGGQR